jgi:NAD(P)-dependent dehydrogenase (short-subunit alcohol dehydrogenase family)
MELAAMLDLVVWITGAGSGVGAATAEVLAKAGASLILSDRNEERVVALAENLRRWAPLVVPSVGDLRDKAIVKQACDLIEQRAGKLDVLVNCVGYNIPNRRWDVLDDESIANLIQTNLFAPFYCTRAALSLMRPRKKGLLIHISSTDGLRVGNVGGPAYSVSKHGIVAMSHSVNLEERENGIRSCVICPGGINTGFLDHRSNPPSAAERGYLLEPINLAETIAFIVRQPLHVCFDQITITPRKLMLQSKQEEV